MIYIHGCIGCADDKMGGFGGISVGVELATKFLLQNMDLRLGLFLYFAFPENDLLFFGAILGLFLENDLLFFGVGLAATPTAF